jgi:hypothetical protein
MTVRICVVVRICIVQISILIFTKFIVLSTALLNEITANYQISEQLGGGQPL